MIRSLAFCVSSEQTQVQFVILSSECFPFLANERDLIRFNLDDGVIPIGMAIDKSDFIYTSLCGAGIIFKIDLV